MKSLRGLCLPPLLWCVIASSACDDPDPPTSTPQSADAQQSFDGFIDTAPSEDVKVKPKPGCSHDGACGPQAKVCDTTTGKCVECLTDQDCAQPDFCLDQVCVPDVCVPGATRCDGPGAVAMCKANGGGWIPSDCEKGTFCEDGTCVPLKCQPGDIMCDGAQVVVCDKVGSDHVLVEDCGAKGQICVSGACVDKGCKTGQMTCASPTTALLCKDGKQGYQAKGCVDTDPCTFDRCEDGVGCVNDPKPDGMACGKDKWCFKGQCTSVVNNLIVIFDTSGSMNDKVPGKNCKSTVWPGCIDPHKACNRIGVSKSVFKKALAHVDTTHTRLAMFRFPQIVWSPEVPLPGKGPFSPPPEPDCVHGYYMGYQAMTTHGAQESAPLDAGWYWDNLQEILCVPFPSASDEDPKAALLDWMDGVETLADSETPAHDNPELRSIGWTPIGRTFFYVGEYLRHKVVIDGAPCKADADCGNPNYVCEKDKCLDPMRACRKTTVVLFTDGGEINKPTDFFAPWVQAKRLAYGLGCSGDQDCVGGALCSCPSYKPDCTPAEHMCLPTDKGTGYYCESTMAPCLPEADPGDDAYCATGQGFYACQPDAMETITASAQEAAQNVLRSPDGKPFGVTVHVVDISGEPNGPKKHSGNIARLGGGKLLSSDGIDEDAFLKSLLLAFDTGPKQGCGVTAKTCGGGQVADACDDDNGCTNDSCNAKTGTCLHTSNTGPCDDGDACTLSDRCFNGSCVPDIPFVETLAGSGGKESVDGQGASAGFAHPLDVILGPGGQLLVSDEHLIRRIAPDGKVVTWAGMAGPGQLDGPLKAARFGGTLYLARGPGGEVYVADTDHHRIRVISAAGVVSTLAGDGKEGWKDGPGAQARFYEPTGMAVRQDPGGEVTLLVADRRNHRIRAISAGGQVSTIAGNGLTGAVDGPALQARIGHPIGLAIGPDGELLIATPYAVRVLGDGVVSTRAGGQPGFANGSKSLARFDTLSDIAINQDGTVWLSDADNHRIRTLTASGTALTLVGGQKAGYIDGYGSVARFERPAGLALDDAGRLFVADPLNRRVRVVQTPRVLCSGSTACNTVACNPGTGKCESQPAPTGAACSTDPCIAGETCKDLTCQGGSPLNCNDNDPCTDDACDPATASCKHAANSAPCDDGSPCTLGDKCQGGGCAGEVMQCDDGDPETDDVCMYGACVAKPNYCTKDSTCDDGDDKCTLDTCVNSQCTYVQTGGQGCCKPVPWANDFDAGDLGNMSLINSLGPGKGWQLWKNDAGANPPLFALYYGDKEAKNFELGGASQGSATTPPVALPPGMKARLRLQLWMDTEGAFEYDVFKIEVITKLGPEPLWLKGPAFKLKSWEPMVFDLGKWSGQVVSVRFSFDTRDDVDNSGLGIYLDKIGFEVDCP